MSDPHDPPLKRLDELLADRALFGTSAEEDAELEQLLASTPNSEQEVLDRIAANLALTSIPTSPGPMPADLQERIRATAALSSSSAVVPTSSAVLQGRRFPLTWLATLAACVLVGIGVWLYSRPAPDPGPAERRLQLLAQAERPDSGIVRLEWKATDDPAAAGASGDVIWSTPAQEGYMRFRGLPANDPRREQYQLWVFDAERDERFPVDGGVFDIPAGEGEVVIPITVKLGVSRPVLFAVTIEPPGGVVVSSRERLPLLAEVPDGTSS
jgi:hypothetical protein